MSSKAQSSRAWTPIDDAVEQARDLNKRARKLARETASEVRSRSEAALKSARKQSEETAKLVRKNIEAAQKAIDEQRDQLGKLPEVARDRLRAIEEGVRKGVERLAGAFNLVTEREFDGLRRKVSQLERRLGEVERHSRAA
jgi:vacuolar-type H+-ATPase subunit H